MQRLYRRLLTPKSPDEDARRRELILNILLLGTIFFTAVLFTITLSASILQGSGFLGTPPVSQLIIVLIFVGLFTLSRYGFHRLVAYFFVGIFFALATWSIFRWGIQLPQGILTYSLLIVMSGVLLSSKVALYMTALVVATLFTIMHLGDVGTVQFDTDWMDKGGAYADVVAYGVTFMVIALVAWLSNREIEQSLHRARASEKDLLEERRSLERTVRERTKALEKAQVEKMLDLQRFAEFGRLSSTLLHELANPLMSVSLDLEQLEGKNRSKFVSRAREGISHMEQYVEAARRQLRNQSEIKIFDIAEEITRVSGFLQPKARQQQVRIKLDLIEKVSVKGDSIRFNQIISNLLSNGIDAYDGVSGKKEKEVTIMMKQDGQSVDIIVEDHGQGIKKDQLPHLFDAFYTTKHATRGTGLGLAITKQAVEEAFQGTISVISDKHHGTRFIVRLTLI